MENVVYILVCFWFKLVFKSFFIIVLVLFFDIMVDLKIILNVLEGLINVINI